MRCSERDVRIVLSATLPYDICSPLLSRLLLSGIQCASTVENGSEDRTSIAQDLHLVLQNQVEQHRLLPFTAVSENVLRLHYPVCRSVPKPAPTPLPPGKSTDSGAVSLSNILMSSHLRENGLNCKLQKTTNFGSFSSIFNPSWACFLM